MERDSAALLQPRTDFAKAPTDPHWSPVAEDLFAAIPLQGMSVVRS